MIDSAYPRVAVTGTKGKTSVIRMLNFALNSQFRQVLRVDTSGAYVNNTLVVSDQESRKKWGYTATNSPGRFLSYVTDPSNVSLLEATVFSAVTGLGYKSHDIGIFTNVFEDHLGGTKLLKTVEDIAEQKSFIFRAIRSGGVAIYNLDDNLVCSQLSKIRKGVQRIGITSRGGTADLDSNTLVCRISTLEIELLKEGQRLAYAKLEDFSWLATQHTPSLYTFAFVFATLYALLDQHRFLSSIEKLTTYSYDPEGGRMVHAMIEDGPDVILDFAHEKYSLAEIAQYARSLAGNNGEVIGVLRLAPSRTDKLIEETADYIAGLYDRFIIYDKVDGYYRKPGIMKGYVDKIEETGRISRVFSTNLLHSGAVNVERIVREDEAIETAVKKSKKGDVIVYIVNDDSARSFNFLKNVAQHKKVSIV